MAYKVTINGITIECDSSQEALMLAKAKNVRVIGGGTSMQEEGTRYNSGKKTTVLWNKSELEFLRNNLHRSNAFLCRHLRAHTKAGVSSMKYIVKSGKLSRRMKKMMDEIEISKNTVVA